MLAHPRTATSSTPSANGTGPHEDLHGLLERLLTPIEDLVDVMGVPLGAIERDDSADVAGEHIAGDSPVRANVLSAHATHEHALETAVGRGHQGLFDDRQR